MRKVSIVLIATMWLVACGQSSATTDTGVDVAAADVDAAGVDGGADVTAATDVAAGTDAVAPDVPDAAGTDAAADETTAPDTDVAEVAPTCSELQAKIDALKPTLTPCTVAKGCTTFEHPICNSFGCFQTPVAQGTDLTALETLASQASAAGCAGFHCGCDVSTPSFCLKGQCRQCPPDCDGSCEEMTAALLTTAHAANWCGTDADCTVLGTGMCPVGDLPCGGMFLNKYAKTEPIQAMLGGYSTACGASTCKCPMPGNPVCVAGKCVAK